MTRVRARVTAEQMEAFVNEIPRDIWKVGVFVNESPAKIEEIGAQLGLDIAQLHGAETPGSAPARHARLEGISRH